MKKLLCLVLAVLMIVSFAGCTEKNDVSDGNDVIKVGMECNYAPYNWSQAEETDGAVKIMNVDNMYTNGYDVQVALMIAEKLGKKLEIYSYEWDSLIPAVQSGNLDMIIAGMSPTPERKEKIDFSNDYYESNLVVITKKDKLSDVKTIGDLNGKKIAAQSGTFHLQALEEQTRAMVSELADFSTMLIALDAGTIEGYIAEEPTAQWRVLGTDEYTYVPFINNETGFKTETGDTSIAVGVKKGNSELLEDINNALSDFDVNSQKELMKKMAEIAPNE